VNRELRAGLGIGRAPLIVLGLVLGVFLIVPLLIIVPTSWTAGQIVQFPPQGFSLQWYHSALTDPTWRSSFFVSLKLGLFASALATVLGTATAFGMRRLARGRGTRIAQALFILPLAIPYISYAVGMYQLFLKLPSSLSNTLIPLVLADATVTMPLVYVVVAAALANVDPALPRAAATMGARWPTIIWKIELPLVWLAILGGFVFAFATVFDEATLAIFLSPIGQTTLSLQLYQAASQSIAPTLSAVSTIITMLAIIVLGVGTLLISRRPALRPRGAA
jgi:putative spermidine/putrescine transport system permease protein